jgi:hypothetical protein
VLGPAGGAADEAAVERRGVVRLDRAEVAGAIGVDRKRAPDREALGVERAEGADYGSSDFTVDHEPAGVLLAVEAPVRERHEPEVAQRDGAASMPRDTGHAPSLGGVDALDRAAERCSPL